MKNQEVITQEELLKLLLPVLKSEGRIFKKVAQVLARKAKEGEVIHTMTGDGHETSNKAGKGDYIVKNLTKAGEQYIVKNQKFKDRYDFQKEEGYGFSRYNSKGKVIAVEMTKQRLQDLGLEAPFHFLASWDEKMIVKANDFLVCQPDFKSVYRIARQEFFETYQLEK